MVQEIAKEMIRQARQEGAQDIYLIPKTTCYELYMRIGDERRFIKTYDFELLSAVISYFKVVAGMTARKPRFQSGCRQLGITVVLKVWLSDSFMTKTGSCAFGLSNCRSCARKFRLAASIYSQDQSAAARRP